MTDDLVKRLRESAEEWDDCEEAHNAFQDREAADRIEELEMEVYNLKYAAAGGEDVPGSAHAVTVKDVIRWQRESAKREAEYISRIEELEKRVEQAKIVFATMRSEMSSVCAVMEAFEND